MFTGIIEATGTVEALQAAAAAAAGSAPTRRLTVATALEVGTLPLGASIAVDGVCLTVVERAAGRFSADLGPETLACTTLGRLGPGDRVHLERPLRMGDALGGHLVSGHVDGVGTILERRERGAALELDVAAPPEVASTLVPKGSIAVDGVSLTVNTVAGERFSVTLIPHTLGATNLGEKAPGAAVNLEGDVIAKHVARMVDAALAARSEAPPAAAARRELSLETLRKHGFAR
jgi:riboflavin synthase